MTFRTKLDYSDNRQIKQRERTNTILSGTTTFGVPFSGLTSGPDMSATAQTSQYFGVVSSYSGNSATTVFTWSIPNVSAIDSSVSALTPSNSGVSQNISAVFGSSSSTIIDGNLVNLTYSGVGATNLYLITMSEPTPGNYTGTVSTDFFIYSAQSLDFTGRTIWIDNTEILRTKKLIVGNNPQPGYVLTCIDSEGMVDFKPVSRTTSGSTYWSASTGTYAIVTKYSESIASGILSLSEGYQTTAIGDYSHAEGQNTTASGDSAHTEGVTTASIGSASHAEGSNTTAIGDGSHVEGQSNISVGVASHAEGSLTIASGDSSHTEGGLTTSIGNYSHAGGNQSIASGDTSFVHGLNSLAAGNYTIVLGNNITGLTDNYTYVESLNVKTVASLPFLNDIRIDANGNLTTNTSDIRLKENITPITNALNIIKSLNGVNYQWKDRTSGGNNIKLGFIAQEVEKVEPKLVFTNKTDGYKGLHIDGMIPLLVEAIKEIVNSDKIILETQTIAAEDNNIELNYNGNNASAIGGGISIINGIDDGIDAEFKLNIEGSWVTNNPLAPSSLIIPEYTPISSYDIYGKNGDITRDENYLYVRDNNTWKRSPLQMF
jgi:hypothetical protein